MKKEFAKPRVLAHFDDMSKLIARNVDSWSELAKNDTPLNMSKTAYELTFNFISAFLFKRDLTHLFPTVHDGIMTMFKVFYHRFSGPVGLIPAWFPVPLFLRARGCRDKLQKQVRILNQ